MSQDQLALVDTASVHIVKGISQHNHNRSCACWLELELERDAWLVSVVAASVVGPCRRARIHILSTGGSFLLLECASAGVSFCWRGWRTLMLAWLEELQLEVCIESTRLIQGSDWSPGFSAAYSVRYCSVYSIRWQNV